MPTLRLAPIAPGFERMDDLLDLILRAFASMNGVIDPPSSALRLTREGLSDKCRDERGIAAFDGDRLVGCVFLAEKTDHFYLGKLAIEPAFQGKGIGRLLMIEAERIARDAGKPVIELQVRLELTANQTAFAKMGFVETARTAHPGYDRPTSITMRKKLGPSHA